VGRGWEQARAATARSILEARHTPWQQSERASAGPSCDSSVPARPADGNRVQRHCPE
jgi:hypothetical protein